MLPSSIKAIVFDAYGTLFDVQTLTLRLQRHFGDQAEAVNEIWRRKQLEYTWLRGMMDRYEPFSVVTMHALAFACQTLRLDLDEQIRTDLLDAYYQLAAFDSVKQDLDRLANSYQLAVLSNADEKMLEAVVRKNGLEKYFTAVISVNQIGNYKPDPAVYRLAVDQLGLPASSISFVSSNTWDVCGAKAFGFDVSWLKRGQLTFDHLGQTPDRVISQVAELGN